MLEILIYFISARKNENAGQKNFVDILPSDFPSGQALFVVGGRLKISIWGVTLPQIPQKHEGPVKKFCLNSANLK